jgi:hypothetical protein
MDFGTMLDESFDNTDKKAVGRGGAYMTVNLIGSTSARGIGGHLRNFYTSSKNARVFPMKIELFSYYT